MIESQLKYNRIAIAFLLYFNVYLFYPFIVPTVGPDQQL